LLVSIIKGDLGPRGRGGRCSGSGSRANILK